MKIAGYIAETTIMVIGVTWVIYNGKAFGTVMQSVATAITGSVNALWGR